MKATLFEQHLFTCVVSELLGLPALLTFWAKWLPCTTSIHSRGCVCVCVCVCMYV